MAFGNIFYSSFVQFYTLLICCCLVYAHTTVKTDPEEVERDFVKLLGDVNSLKAEYSENRLPTFCKAGYSEKQKEELCETVGKLVREKYASWVPDAGTMKPEQICNVVKVALKHSERKKSEPKALKCADSPPMYLIGGTSKSSVFVALQYKDEFASYNHISVKVENIDIENIGSK